MITEANIKELLEQRIGGTDIFLVEVVVRPGNVIRIELDRPDGISIDECVSISRFMNEQLDRDVEDYSLEVSSPGVGTPFRVKQQYNRNIGRDIEVVQTDGKITSGKLRSVSEDGIVIEQLNGVVKLEFDSIKTSKAIISFN